MTTTTPETINRSTPEIQTQATKISQSTKNYIYNKNIIQQEIMSKQGKAISQEKMQDIALKMTENLLDQVIKTLAFYQTQQKMKKTELLPYPCIIRLDVSTHLIHL